MALLSQFLGDAGHKVVAANDARSLGILLESGRPDVAIIDMEMGGGGGPAAAGFLRRAYIPFIVCSGMPVEDQKKWFGAVPKTTRFFRKPVDLIALSSAIQSVLAEARG